MSYGKVIRSPKHLGNQKQHSPLMEIPYQTIRSDISFPETHCNGNEIPEGKHVDHP